ncbi:MAG TPA: hypothetical protein PK829_13590, partial [Promineifilum sp.]|nr:hypothetical protein [Promineifilum sp.]
DKRTIELLWAYRADRLEHVGFVTGPRHIDPFEVRAAEAALLEAGLPAVPWLVAGTERSDAPDLARFGWVAGAAILPMAEEAWDVAPTPEEAAQLVRHADQSCTNGPYLLPSRVKPNEAVQGDLVDLLNSEDPAVRLAPAARLIRQLREAEQWLAEALAWTDRALALVARWTPTPNARLARAELAHRRERLLRKLT